MTKFIVAFAPCFDNACTERFAIAVSHKMRVIELTRDPAKATRYSYDEALRIVNGLQATKRYTALAQPVN